MSEQEQLTYRLVYRCLRCGTQFDGDKDGKPPRDCPFCKSPIDAKMLEARKVEKEAE